MILFTRRDCPDCAYIKSLLEPGQLADKLQLASVDTDEGLALLALYEGISLAEKELPLLVDHAEDLSDLMVRCEWVTGLDELIARLLERDCISLDKLAGARPGAWGCEEGACRL